MKNYVLRISPKHVSLFQNIFCDIDGPVFALLKNLAGISTRLNEVLKLLNNPAFTPNEAELERLTKLADAGLDEQEELLGDFHSSNSK